MRDMYGHSDVRHTLPQCIHSAILRSFQPKPAQSVLGTSEPNINIAHLWPEPNSYVTRKQKRKVCVNRSHDTVPGSNETNTPVHFGDFNLLHVISLMCAEIYDLPRWTLYAL